MNHSNIAEWPATLRAKVPLGIVLALPRLDQAAGRELVAKLDLSQEELALVLARCRPVAPSHGETPAKPGKARVARGSIDPLRASYMLVLWACGASLGAVARHYNISRNAARQAIERARRTHPGVARLMPADQWLQPETFYAILEAMRTNPLAVQALAYPQTSDAAVTTFCRQILMDAISLQEEDVKDSTLD